jgi:hypothetical protein
VGNCRVCPSAPMERGMFELPLFVRAQGNAEMGADLFAEFTAEAGGKDRNFSMIHRTSLLCLGNSGNCSKASYHRRSCAEANGRRIYVKSSTP